MSSTRCWEENTMKKRVIASTALALAATVYAACPEPSGLPVCRAGVPNSTVNWPCCDQTAACPADGTKWARFIRSANAYSTGAGPYCYFVPTWDGSILSDSCCGDPYP